MTFDKNTQRTTTGLYLAEITAFGQLDNRLHLNGIITLGDIVDQLLYDMYRFQTS